MVSMAGSAGLSISDTVTPLNGEIVALSSVTVMMAGSVARSASTIVTPLKGWVVPLSLIAWLATVPRIVGGLLIAVAMTDVVESLARFLPSVKSIVNVVTTTLPGVT